MVSVDLQEKKIVLNCSDNAERDYLLNHIMKIPNPVSYLDRIKKRESKKHKVRT